MKYGYCRISTDKQSIERQRRNILTAYPDAHLIEETYTGTTTERPQWQQLLKKIQPGDTIIFDSVSRMSRNAEEGFCTYRELMGRQIDLVFIKEPYVNTQTFKEAKEKKIDVAINTGDAVTQKFLETILTAVNDLILGLAEKQIEIAFDQSEKEVADLRQRTKEGLQTAKNNGKQVGAAVGRTFDSGKSAPIKELIRKYSKDFDGTLSDVDVMDILQTKEVTYKRAGHAEKTVSAKLSRNTYYQYKNEMRG